ncbi:MAG: hypothetical protein IT373_28030 [Polyangiaceae bacterium]|nr:hypothetical protein [Polyangiaceae bacterium]
MTIRRLRPFALALALAAAVSAPSGTARAAEPPAEAQAHFKAGVSFLQDPEGARYEEAYAEFKHAFELSGSPKVLGNLGLCAMKLERDGEAIDSYARYLAEVSDIDPDERAQIERDLETLRVSAVRVTLTVEPAPESGVDLTVVDTRVPVRGTNVRNTYRFGALPAVLVLRPGHHVLDARVAAAGAPEWDATLAPGARLEHRFVLAPAAPVPEPPPPEPPPPPPAPHSLVGPGIVTSVGAAALVAGAALGGVALGKVSDLEDRCPGNVCPPDAASSLDTTRGFVRASDFLMLGGGLVAAAGLGWLAWALADEPSHESASAPAPARFGGAACDARGCAAAVAMEF